MEEYGRRIKFQEENFANLQTMVDCHKKEHLSDIQNALKTMENTKKDILNKLDESNRSLKADWSTREEERKVAVEAALKAVRDQLSTHETRHKREEEELRAGQEQLQQLSSSCDLQFTEIRTKLQSNDEGDQAVQDELSNCRKYVEFVADNLEQNVKETNKQINAIKNHQKQTETDITMNNEKVSKAFCSLTNDLSELNGNHKRLKQFFESHKIQVESQNRFNAEEQEKTECELRKLNESKGAFGHTIIVRMKYCWWIK